MSPPPSIGINLRVSGGRNQGGRKYMEDFFSVAFKKNSSDDEQGKGMEYAFFGIFDGHGGSEAAKFAKDKLMIAIVTQKLFWSDCDQDILKAIREGYILTHYSMWREQEKWPRTATGLPSTAGTTASVAFIRRGKIYIGHVGDSGIVLGYQEEGEKFWRAKQLTNDHKPECNIEKARIINSGGKVVTKSGVPRVVWNRPRIGHKGPVRRSTPIDEIPFLAVARSLGDLWSYNSALNEFVVSPVPDVKVVKIDPKTYRCLIFGTDGLWNVVSADDAVKIAYYTGNGTNPSKYLVDKALEKWSIRKMRADNTSVLTVMFDPLGSSPKKDSSRSYNGITNNMDYNQGFYNSVGLNEIIAGNCDNIMQPTFPPGDKGGMAIYDHSVRDLGNSSSNFSVPSAGSSYNVMSRYETNCDSNVVYYNSHNDMSSSSTTNLINSTIDTNNLTHDSPYMNSFAESYNSLLISSYEQDASNDNFEKEFYTNWNDSTMLNSEHHMQSQIHQYQHSHHPQQQQHRDQQHQQHYQPQFISGDEGYSLTKLETRCEQQFNSMRNSYMQHQHPQQQQEIDHNITFPEFGHHSHDGVYNHYNGLESPYHPSVSGHSSRSHLQHYIDQAKRADNGVQYVVPQTHLVSMNYEEEERFYDSSMSPDDDESHQACSTNSANNLPDEETPFLDESIQINEISSSVIEPIPNLKKSVSDAEENVKDKLSPSPADDNALDAADDDSTMELCDNSDSDDTGMEAPTHSTSSDNSSSSSSARRTILCTEQNENLSKVEPRILRSSALVFTVDYTKRTLRSRNLLTKEMKAKSSSTTKQHISRSAAITTTNQFLKSSNVSLRSRQIQQVTVWPPSRQKKASRSPIGGHMKQSSTSVNNDSFNKIKTLVCSKTKTSVRKSNSNNNSSTSSSSRNKLLRSSAPSPLSLTSPVTSSSMSKRSSSSRNGGAWCRPGKAIQTKNKIQKRLNH